MKNKNFSFIIYILLNFLKPFLIISFVLTSVVWLSRSLKYIDLIINKGLSLPSYFWFVSLIAPKILALLLPLISFVAIIYTYQKLKTNSEIIVMESFGLSKIFIMLPSIIFGFIVAIILFLIEAYISPNNYKTFKTFQADLRNNFMISVIQEGSFHNPIQGLTVFIDKIKRDGSVKNILIHDNRNKKIESTIIAKEGVLSNFSSQPSITVFNGTRYVYNKKDQNTSILNFDKYEFQINVNKKIETVRFKQVEERTLKELLFPNPSFSNRLKNELLAEGHRRLSSPLLAIFMCILASFSILFGEMKKKMLLKNIIICSSIAVLTQAVYISIMSNIIFSVPALFIPYISLILISFIPPFLLIYEIKILYYLNKFRHEA
ncbi:MAG: hypothetical protein CMP40_00925 [Rickettsiales bacterium]|nr:hypothetical protein [Rickettsiales bacterium]